MTGIIVVTPVKLPPPTPALTDAERIGLLEQRLHRAELENALLREMLRLERIRKYGPGSEKLSDLQLNLLEGEPGVTREEVEAESRREPLPDAPSGTSVARGPRHPGRQKLPEHLPRVERIVACPPEQCVCEACGSETALVGYEQSEQLDREPARYFVLVTRREKRACRSCPQGGVKAAPLPARIIAKSLVSDRVVVDTIVSKYGDHQPLYRQSAMLERDAGVTISRATMDGWLMQVGNLLIPVAGAMALELLSGTYLQVDETPVPVQSHDGRGKNLQAYLWQYGRPGGSAVFDFRPGRGREGPKKFLGQFAGILQTDGYAAYDRVGGAGIVHAACWAHARRKLIEAVKLNPDDRVAAALARRIDALFAVDAEARASGLDHEARHALRLERSAPLLGLLRTELEQARAAALPAGALGKAVSYTLSLWTKLTCFLQHPELELSNNLAENSMRPVALGRKNWIHIGSEEAGPKVAAILSVVESCRRLNIPLRDYLSAALPGLAGQPISNVRNLTPAAWAASRS